MDATVAAWRLAERQWGVVALRQMLEGGIGRATVARWAAAGRLHRVHPGVYAVGHRKLTDQGWLAAALLYAGKGSALSHITGGWWCRMIERRPTRIDVTAPRRRASLPGLELHRSRDLERIVERGLPVTPPARILLDIAPLLPERRLRRVLAETLYRRLATPEEIEAVAGRGKRGSRTLRAALAAHVPELARTKSELEDRFIELCEEHGIPLPEVNVRVCGIEVDAYWPDFGLVVELDGDSSHGGPGRVANDRARELTLREAGLRVRRFSWPQVTRESTRVAADVISALASANPRQESAGAG